MNSRLLSRSFSRSLSSLIDAVPGGGFSFLDYDPYILIDYDYAALKTGGDPADLYDPVETLLNEGTASDATQTTALNQGLFLKNDGGNFLHLPEVANNYARFDTPIIPETGDFELEIDFRPEDVGVGNFTLLGQYRGGSPLGRMVFQVLDGVIRFFMNDGATKQIVGTTPLVKGQFYTAKLVRNGDIIEIFLDDDSEGLVFVLEDKTILDENSEIGRLNGSSGYEGIGCISRIHLTTGGVTYGLTMDEMEHNQTSYECANGETFDLVQFGDNPCKLIAYPCVRHNGVHTYHAGTFPEDLAGAHLFIVYDVLNGPSPYNDRVFTAGRTGYSDTAGESSPMALSLGGKFATYTSASNLAHTAAFNGRAIQSVKVRDGLLSTNLNGEALSSTPALPSLQFQSWAIGSEFSGGGNSKPPMDVLFVMLVDKDLSADDEAVILSELNNRFQVY